MKVKTKYFNRKSHCRNTVFRSHSERTGWTLGYHTMTSMVCVQQIYLYTCWKKIHWWQRKDFFYQCLLHNVSISIFNRYRVKTVFWISFTREIQIFSGKLKYLTMTETDRVWMPDTFFQNEKLGHFHDIIVPNVYIRIFPTGRVLYSIRYPTWHCIVQYWTFKTRPWPLQNIIDLSLSYGPKVVPVRQTRMRDAHSQL